MSWRRRHGGPAPARLGVKARAEPVVELADPDPTWKRVAWEELSELWRLLEPWCVAGVHHVGSTAVPEVPARPVIDLWAGLADADQAAAAGAVLEAAGWHREPVRTGQPGGDPASAGGPVYTCSRGDGLRVAVELLPAGGAKWNAGLLLRDRLRADERLRREYARSKRRAATRATSHADYQGRKAAFLQRAVEG